MQGAAKEHSGVASGVKSLVSGMAPLGESEMPAVAVCTRVETIVSHALAVIQPISRTFCGISDTSTSDQKQALLYEGPELATLVSRNFTSVLTRLLESNELNLPTETEVEQFFVSLVGALNYGLTRSGQGMWRSWETGIKGQSSPDEIDHHMRIFYREFAEKFNYAHHDPIAFAAWNEKRLNAEIHPLADGCGRTSKALAVLILGRANLLYPRHQSREVYFERINLPLDQWTSYYRGEVIGTQCSPKLPVW